MSQQTKRKPKHCLKLWLKFKPAYQRTPNGVVIHKNRYNGSASGRKQALGLFQPYLQKLIQEERIWQARIYDSINNRLLFQWPKP